MNSCLCTGYLITVVHVVFHKAKYFEDASELTFDEIMEQVQGTDLPIDTKEYLREVNHIVMYSAAAASVILLTNCSAFFVCVCVRACVRTCVCVCRPVLEMQ